MATYTESAGFVRGGPALPAAGVDRETTVTVYLDLAEIVAARSDAGLPALTTSDKLEVLRVPAKTMVSGVVLDVIEVDTTKADGTVSVGDAGSGTKFTAATNIDGNETAGLVVGTQAAAVYDDSAAILVTFGTAMSTDAKLRIIARLTNLN